MCDALKSKHRDETATELYERTKSFCEINEIPDPAHAGGKSKQKRLDGFVIVSACGGTF